jgi:hypothetical protein
MMTTKSTANNTYTIADTPHTVPAQSLELHERRRYGRHGPRWEPAEGEDFPEYAFVDRFLGVAGKP